MLTIGDGKVLGVVQEDPIATKSHLAKISTVMTNSELGSVLAMVQIAFQINFRAGGLY